MENVLISSCHSKSSHAMNDSAGSTLTVSEKKGDEISDENSEESENKQIEEEEPSLVGSKSSKR